MNKHQKFVIAAGAVVVLVMFLFPPFHVEIRGTTHNMGYAFILEPPFRGATASVNIGMLLIQWVGALLLTGLAFFMLKSLEESPTLRSPAPSSGLNPPENEGQFPAAEVENLQNERHERHFGVDQSKSFFGGTYHPWRRFFARTVDLFTTGLLVLVLLMYMLGYFVPDQVDGLIKALENPFSAGIILYIAWLPVEAAFLSVTGTTPAKWIFGITVSASGGARLSYALALKRASLVWIQGEGLGIPLVTLITRLFAYQRLTKTGTTLWDQSVDAVVTHKKWGLIRAVASVVVVLATMMIIAALNDVGDA